MQTPGKKVLLSSGGMDSMLLAQTVQTRGAIHLFVDIGQKYLEKELGAAQLVAEQAGAIFIAEKTMQLARFEHETGIIPFRNAEMILCAAQYGTDIYLGVIADEVNSDKSVEFCAAMEAVLNISHKKQYWTEGKQFRVLTPLREFTKSQLIADYLQHGGSLPSLLKTVSCYSPSETHCGQCASCFKRWVALTNALQTDAAGEDCEPYLVHPARHREIGYWRQKLHGYPVNRLLEVESAYAIYERDAQT
jgi:7-cyano-7-deazaguanine synthase